MADNAKSDGLDFLANQVAEGDDTALPPGVTTGGSDAEATRDDAMIAAIAGVLALSRGDAFLQGLIDRLGQPDLEAGALAPFLHQLRRDLRDLPDETGAFEQFIDALDDPALDGDDLKRAVPVLAALAARAIVRGLAFAGGRLGAHARRNLARGAVAATRDMVDDRRRHGLKPLPLLARYLVHHALKRNSQPVALAEVLPRIAARLSNEPALLRRLVLADAPQSNQTWRGIWGRSRHSELRSPVEITILAR